MLTGFLPGRNGPGISSEPVPLGSSPQPAKAAKPAKQTSQASQANQAKPGQAGQAAWHPFLSLPGLQAWSKSSKGESACLLRRATGRHRAPQGGKPSAPEASFCEPARKFSIVPAPPPAIMLYFEICYGEVNKSVFEPRMQKV